jgi:long-subunit acyl-CoA synthetase (AMP-forming)
VDPTTFLSRPHDTEGEIIVSGPTVMVGYHNNQKANDEVFVNLDGKRFFRTGDIGKFVEGKVCVCYSILCYVCLCHVIVWLMYI